MSSNWNEQAEFIATARDPKGPGLWLVELGAGRTVIASISPAAVHDLSSLAPGDSVRIKFRMGNKTPRIIGYSEIDRSGHATGHQH